MTLGHPWGPVSSQGSCKGEGHSQRHGRGRLPGVTRGQGSWLEAGKGRRRFSLEPQEGSVLLAPGCGTPDPRPVVENFCIMSPSSWSLLPTTPTAALKAAPDASEKWLILRPSQGRQVIPNISWCQSIRTCSKDPTKMGACRRDPGATS